MGSEEESDSPAPTKAKAAKPSMPKANSKKAAGKLQEQQKKPGRPPAKKARASEEPSEQDIEIDLSEDEGSEAEGGERSQAKQNAKGKAGATKKKEPPRPAFGNVKSGPVTGT